ncbi:ribosome silencing factor [bacterium]|nr:ribosome silencing factor [bacterium]
MESLDRAKEVARAALDIKAEDVVILDVRDLTSFTSYFVIASGRSDRQVKSIADSIWEKLKTNGQNPLAMEGYESGSWVLVDFGDVIAHSFFSETREFYNLEKLWSDAPRIKVDE